MARFPISRRAMLRGSLAGATATIGLPMLDYFRDRTPRARAAAGNMKYFGVFFWGNGNVPSRWVPEATGDQWGMTDQLAPLAAVRDRFTVVSNLAVKTSNAVAHASGAAGIFSGSALMQTAQGETLATPSIDQLLADKLGSSTPYRSIETSCENGESWSYRAPFTRNSAIFEPATLFANVFGGGIMSGSGGDTVGKALRVSVLDAVLDDANRLAAKLGANDARRLDQHLTAIRELERRLAPRDPSLPPPVCDFPATPEADYPAIEGRAQLSAKSRAFVDILVHAVQCGQVNVFSHWFTRSVTDVLFRSGETVPVVDGHHRLTHDEAGDQPMVNECVKQVMAEFAYMIEAFDAVPDPDGGSLLDHMVLLATSDCSLGRQHRLDEYPILYAGTGGGTFRTGQHIRLPAVENASRLMLSFLQAADLSFSEFGTGEGRATEALTEVLV